MTNFFQAPMIPRVTNPEPPGFNLIRQMLMNQMFQRNANPFGMNPGGGGGNPLFPSGGRGTFDPYGGGRVGNFMPGGTPGQGVNMGYGPHSGKYPPGGSPWNTGGGGGNNFMQMLQQFLQQMQGGQMGGGRQPGTMGFRGAPEPSGGVGIGTRPPTPNPGGPVPTATGNQAGDTAGGGSGGQLPLGMPTGGGGMSTATPPEPTGDPYNTPQQFDGEPEYDGRRDAGKAIHAHMAMLKSVLPMLMQPSRVATAAPNPSSGGPMPGYDGASMAPMGGGFHPYDGMAPETAPSWSPLSERSGGTGLNLAESNTPNTLPMNRDVPPLPRPGYDGVAYGGFSRVRAPMAMPHAPMAPRGPMNVASGLNRILAGGMGANRRGQIGLSRLGSTHSAFDGNPSQPRGPAPSPDDHDIKYMGAAAGGGPDTLTPGQNWSADPGTSGTAGSGQDAQGIPITGGGLTMPPTGGFDPGGSASPYPTGGQTGGQAMYPWYMPYTGQRTAGMSPFEMQGLGNMSDFVGGGMNLGGAQGYLNDLLGGKYIGSDNPYMQDFQKGAQTLKDNEDQLARQRIGSSMAAGGNALSGARMASEQQYQNLSDASFQKMLAEMQMQNLARERALQQGGVGLQGGLSNELMGGYGQLMGAGAVPRNIQQGDFNSQYNDWLRQIGAMQQGDQFQQQLATQMLHTSPGAYQPGYGTSAAEGIAALLAGSGAGSTIGDLLKKLLGGGGGGTSGGGGMGKSPGTDASGKSPGQQGYNPFTDPGSGMGASGPIYTDQNGVQWVRDPETGAYVPQDSGYDEQSFNDWLAAGGSNGGDFGDQNMYNPYGEFGDQNMYPPYDYGLGDFNDYGLGGGGGYDTSGGDEYWG